MPVKRLLPACLLAMMAGCAVPDGQVASAGSAWPAAPAVTVVDAGPQPVVPAGDAVSARPAARLPGDPGLLEASNDLYALSLQLRARADGGDVQAAWQLSRIHEYCAGHAADPARYAQVGPPGIAGVASARQRISQRCAGFAPGDGLAREQVLAARRQAALAGSLAAEASLLALGRPLLDDADYRRDLVERVLATGDAEALYALAPAMGLRAARDPAMAGLVAGDVDAELAWRLAACRLGKDCGPGSMVMDSYCAHGGICSSREGDHLIDLVQRAPQADGKSDQATLLMQQLLEARRLAWR